MTLSREKYNIITEVGITMKLVKLIKMCLKEKYRFVRIGENLFDSFPIQNGLKQGDALSPVFFNFALEYAIRKVQENHEDLEWNETHLILVYADDVNLLGKSMKTVQRKYRKYIDSSNEICLEMNAKKITYTFLSRDQNAGQHHNLTTGNKLFENVVKVEDLGTTVTNQNYVHKGIRSRQNSGNA
jgi:hypothetical protein